MWADRMRKLRSAGFNAIQFYVEWNRHEAKRGHYEFTGRLDIEAFIDASERVFANEFLAERGDTISYPLLFPAEKTVTVLKLQDVL